MPRPLEAPRLLKWINDAGGRGSPSVLTSMDSPASVRSAIADALDDIDIQLRQVLDDSVWNPLSGARATMQQPRDEAWARLHSELCCFLPYITPGGLYGTSDVDVYDAIYNEGWYPLGFECQQHTTMGLILRGADRADLGSGCNAGATSGIPLFKRPGNTWVNGPASTPADLARGLGPGTLVEFWPTRGVPNPNVKVNPSDTNYGADHIGIVHRIHRPSDPGDPTPLAVQFFDTGAIVVDGSIGNRMAGVTTVPPGTLYVNGDDPWAVKSWQVSGGNCTGFGITSDSRVPAGLARGQALFPMGLARLVIRTREQLDVTRSDQSQSVTPGTVLFATPLLRMHSDTQNFAVSRLARSLVGYTGHQTLEARWEISTPESPLFALLRRDKRRLRDLSTPVLGLSSKPIRALGLRANIDIVTRVDGTIEVQRKCNDTTRVLRTDAEPWGEIAGEFFPDAIPSYFTGGAPLPRRRPD